MVLPLVVIDVHEEAAKNPDYTLSLDGVKKWETDHGQIPAGAFVCDADRLVEALARRGKDGKQGCQWYCTLSRMGFAGMEAPFWTAQDYRVWS
jgi:hypothetical protein